MKVNPLWGINMNEELFAPTMSDVQRAAEFLNLDEVGRFYTDSERAQIMRIAEGYAKRRKRR